MAAQELPKMEGSSVLYKGLGMSQRKGVRTSQKVVWTDKEILAWEEWNWSEPN